MQDYFETITLLGLKDQNLPLYKDTREKRLESVDKMLKLLRILPRLSPKPPSLLFGLNEFDPEFEDKMVYPQINWFGLLSKSSILGCMSLFYFYNYNLFQFNKNYRMIRYLFPITMSVMTVRIFRAYWLEHRKITEFEAYCKKRATELVEENKYLLDTPEFKNWVNYNEEMREVMSKVHRQANNHDASDFKDSELILQDFIRKKVGSKGLRKALFPDGEVVIEN